MLPGFSASLCPYVGVAFSYQYSGGKTRHELSATADGLSAVQSNTHRTMQSGTNHRCDRAPSPCLEQDSTLPPSGPPRLSLPPSPGRVEGSRFVSVPEKPLRPGGGTKCVHPRTHKEAVFHIYLFYFECAPRTIIPRLPDSLFFLLSFTYK